MAFRNVTKWDCSYSYGNLVSALTLRFMGTLLENYVRLKSVRRCEFQDQAGRNYSWLVRLWSRGISKLGKAVTTTTSDIRIIASPLHSRQALTDCFWLAG